MRGHLLVARGLVRFDEAPSELRQTGARGLLRELFGGDVPLNRRGRELWAQMKQRSAALLQRTVRIDGSGGSLFPLSARRPEIAKVASVGAAWRRPPFIEIGGAGGQWRISRSTHPPRNFFF